MDIFKQKRMLIAAIIILVLLNLTTIFLLWMGKPKNVLMKPDMMDHKNPRLEQILKEELDFNKDQVDRFLALRKEHHNNIMKLNEEIRLIKKDMFDRVIIDGYKKEIADSLLDAFLKKQREIEERTIIHFVDLENICNNMQKEKLMKIMHKILGPPEPERFNGPPHTREDLIKRPPPPQRD